MKHTLINLSLILALTALPALLQAGRYDRAIGDAENLNRQISAFSQVNSGDVNAVNRARGNLSAMKPFFTALGSSLSGVDIGPAAQIRNISLELEVKIETAKGEQNLFKLGLEIANSIGPMIVRLKALLPRLIAELKKSNSSAASQVKQLIAPVLTATPASASAASAYIQPLFRATPAAFRPTPADPQYGGPNVGGPQISSPPPPPGNPGLLPPDRVTRATPTPQPYRPTAPVELLPTAVPTAVGVLKAPAAILIPEHQRWIYVAQSNVGQVAVIDTSTRRVSRTIAVGSRPVALAMAENSAKLIVVNYASNNVTVIDGRTHAVLATIAVGSQPVDAVVMHSGRKAYVLNQGSGTVSVILLNNNQILKTIQVGAGPSAIEMQENGRTLYVSNTRSDTVSIIDTSVDEVVAEVTQ